MSTIEHRPCSSIADDGFQYHRKNYNLNAAESAAAMVS